MHARMTSVQIKPGKIDETLRLWRESVLPVANQQQGFKGVLLLVNRTTDKALSITLWETEAAMQAVEASGFVQAQIAKFAPLFAAQPVVENYEVGLQA